MSPETQERETYERILDAGAQAIAARGFHGCGLAEILKLAGVPKGSFYHYFASKEEFGVALIERASNDYLEWLRPIVTDRRRSPLERLRAILQEGYDECRQNGTARACLVPKLALETSVLSDPVHAAVKCAYARWTAVLAQVIREGQSKGEIATDQEPERLANVLVMLWEGATIRMEIERSQAALDDFLAFVFDSLLPPRT
jgi:TetR/AcrR family transcriptional repressor of nem operon